MNILQDKLFSDIGKLEDKIRLYGECGANFPKLVADYREISEKIDICKQTLAMSK